MNNPTTGFICKNASGVYQDLSGIFQPLPNGGTQTSTTGFIALNGKDLNEIFLPATLENYISFNTNFLVNNVDLKNTFAPYNPIPFSITPSGSYTSNYVSGIYTITFTANASMNLYVAVNSANLLVVGGGGNGGGYIAGGNNGGGGSGGVVKNYTGLTSINLVSSTYAVTIGGSTQSSSIGTYTASGGTSGAYQTPGNNGSGYGTGGTGSSYNSGQGANGADGVSISWLSNTYYGGGGGGGGYSTGGSGGGANGPPLGSAPNNGQANTGGGGAGGLSFMSGRTNPGSGGSGVVVLQFTYP